MSLPVTIEDIRSYEPCWDPSKFLPENWSGTTDDIFNLPGPLVVEKIWFFMRNEYLTDIQIEQFISDVGAIEGEFENLRVKAMTASEAAIAKARLDAAPPHYENNPQIDLRQAAAEAEVLRQLDLLAVLVATL